MHTILSVAGILALVAMAFGKLTAVILARILILGTVALVAFVIEEKLTHGLILFRLLGL
jgi:hypothetical protein